MNNTYNKYFKKYFIRILNILCLINFIKYT